MKKKKKSRNLILLLILLLLACAGYYALTKYNAAQEAKETESEVGAEKLLGLTGTINRISYEAGGETVSLTQADSTWRREGDENYPVSQGSVSSILSTLKAAEKQKEIPDATSKLADYGLDAPAVKVTVGDDTGASEVLLIGDVNTTAGGCYGMIEGSGQVYLTDSALASAFDKGWMDLLAVDNGPEISSTKIKDITIEKGGQTQYLKYEAAGLPENDYTEKANLFYQKEDGSFLPFGAAAQSSILNKIGAISYKSVTAYQPTEEEKAAAGLSEPTAVITIRYTEEETVTKKAETEGEEDTTETVESEKQFVLNVGNYDEENGQYFVSYEGGSTILTMDDDNLSAILELNERTIANLNPNEIADTSIDGVDLTYGGVTKALTVERKEVTEEKTATAESTGDGSTEETTAETAVKTEVTYYLDGEEITAETFQKYQKALKIEGQRVLEEDEALPVSGDIFTVTYHRNVEAFPTVTITYIPYNENYYQVSVNGAEPSIVVNIRDVESLIQMFQNGVTEE